MCNKNQAFPDPASNVERWSAHSQMAVLVVDDDESIRNMVGCALAIIGFKVVKAANGMQAFECLLENPVDLVITDLQMPVMDGLALTHRVNRHCPQTPVVIVTGRGWLDENETHNELSVFAVLQKPFRLDKLQNVALQAVRTRLHEYVGETAH
jgi:DNA-binding NtrC family response regulator